MFSKGKIIRLNKNPLSLVVIRKREEKIHENLLYIQYSVKESKRFEIRATRKSSIIYSTKYSKRCSPLEKPFREKIERNSKIFE